MGQVANITDKLAFDENPVLEIKDQKIEINADAPTVLKIMDLMTQDDPNVTKAYELLFSEKERKKIDKLHLSFKDFNIVIECAMNLAAGETEGE